MIENESLENIVKELIALKKEGVYWDFKQEYHKNNVDLVHDIICLANAKYDADRYLIFGVADNSKIIGIIDKEKTQADIINTLRDSKFADNIFPDIRLEKLSIEGKRVDILIIKNTNNKPYYLTKNKDSGKKYIYAGRIYSRIMDTNTPKDGLASSKDIEYMWKERFGLTQTPLDRFAIYLKDYNGWDKKEERVYYKQFPEFTIEPLENNYCDGCEGREWARGEVGYSYSHGNLTSVFGFFYHSTLLKKICCVQFDGGKKHIVNPDWEAIGRGRIYFYLKDSFEYLYQEYMSQEYNIDYSKDLIYQSKTFDIPIFSDKEELSQFLEYAKNELDIENNFEPERDKNKQTEIFHQLLVVYDKFKEVR